LSGQVGKLPSLYILAVSNPSLRRDIASAYLVTAMRLLAWATVIAAVVRVAGSYAFALLGLVQSTVGILEYAAIGLSPAIIRLSAEAMKQALDANGNVPLAVPHREAAVQRVYANGLAMAILTAMGGVICFGIFMFYFHRSKTNAEGGGVAFELVFMVGLASLIRLMSDAPGASLQTTGKIFVDNLLLSLHEAIWVVGTIINLYIFHLPWQRATGFALLAGSVLLLILRSITSHQTGTGMFEKWWKRLHPDTLRRMFLFGGMVVAAQMGDYLYAPTDYILIAKLIGLGPISIYLPAVQVDGGALLLVTALATVLLPRTALAHAAANPHTVRRYYIRGTLATGGMLLIAAPIALWLSPLFFRLLIGQSMPETVAILPMMLIHTVLGGSSMVGRSILLAIGKVRAFTISVLIAGVANVVFSYAFVRFGHMGLRGIILGTIVAVTGRCLFWMPWYTLRALRSEEPSGGPPLLEPISSAPAL
jgi:O-antigen/teichoic acid export membrane protein